MRFTIRDVLWLTALLGMACAWWIDRQGQSSAIDKLNDDLKQHKLALQWLERHGPTLPENWRDRF